MIRCLVSLSITFAAVMLFGLVPAPGRDLYQPLVTAVHATTKPAAVPMDIHAISEGMPPHPFRKGKYPKNGFSARFKSE
nr:hypothetical protein [Candidatus Sigynarchaeum springense]